MHPHRIDTHHHVMLPEYVAALAALGVHGEGLGKMPFPGWTANDSLGLMDRHGIAAAVVSVSAPGVFFDDIGLARRLARQCNESLAALVQQHPTRFGAFATLPLPDVEASVGELAHALDVLNFDGVILMTSIGRRYLGDPMFDPLMAELDRRAAVVLIHPTTPPGFAAAQLELPAAMVDYVLDTTRATANLLMNGVLERCPNIRFILSHAGGTVPYIASRILGLYAGAKLAKLRADGTLAPADAPAHFAAANAQGMRLLKGLYYDTALSYSKSVLRSLEEIADASHVLFGTDWPFAPEMNTAMAVRDFPLNSNFGPEQQRGVERDNALRLFPGLAARLGEGKGATPA